MRLSYGLAAAVLFTACGGAKLQVDEALTFGDLAIGQSRDVALLLVNSGDEPTSLTFGTSSAEFRPLEAVRTVGPGQSETLLIRFSPRELGPRSGKLIITSDLGRSFVALSGRGTGPQLSVPAHVRLPSAALVSGQPAEVVSTTLTLQNTGTLGSLLVLQPPRVEGDALCVGTFVDARCEPWTPPATLETQTLLEVPLSLRATSPGARHFTVVFASNDVLHPEVTVSVDTRVESFEPCVFTAPAEVLLAQGPRELRLTNMGSGTCLVQNATLTSTPAQSLRLGTRTFPVRLESRASFSLWLESNLQQQGARSGVLHVLALGTAPLDIPVRWEPPLQSCLAIVPSTLEFGEVGVGCNSSNRWFALYNTCATPLTVTSFELAAAAGEGPGGPNCPGQSPCPEFFVVTGVQAGTVIQPGSVPVTFGLKYRPINYGPDTGAVLVHTEGEAGPFGVALQGRGDLAAAPQVDRFLQDTRPIIDLLVMVDASPSFVPRRGEVRTNLSNLFRRLDSLCWDGRVGFAAADVGPDAGVELLVNDAGTRWTSTLEVGFADRALSAFDALPIGSELEGCIGPAATLMQDAGVRDGGNLAGLCITDALEHTPNPMAALQAFRGALPLSRSTWSTITGLDSSPCAIEAADDGVHQSLVTATNGAREDLCAPSWWGSLVPLGSVGCTQRTTFFLTSRTEGPWDLSIDGQPVPPSDWTFDASSNSVVFVPGHEPAPGQTLEVTYTPLCVP